MKKKLESQRCLFFSSFSLPRESKFIFSFIRHNLLASIYEGNHFFWTAWKTRNTLLERHFVVVFFLLLYLWLFWEETQYNFFGCPKFFYFLRFRKQQSVAHFHWKYSIWFLKLFIFQFFYRKTRFVKRQ